MKRTKSLLIVITIAILAPFIIKQLTTSSSETESAIEPTPVIEVISEEPETEVEQSDAEVMEEIEQSQLSDDVKKQLKKDLEYVDVNVDLSQFDKYRRRVAAQAEEAPDSLLEDLVNEMERKMNDGDEVQWTEAERELIHELSNN